MSLNTDVVLQLDNVYKKFCLNLKRSMVYGGIDFLKGSLGILAGDQKVLRPSEFWALNSVSFQLKRGSTVGLIGRNGSGKSTLLRLIAGILPPDHGKIAIRGRVGALISLGAGFHPHLSGRENIFMNGVILGMSRAEITKKLDSIIDFAELGEFIDAPISTYSSGMTVRLGFSIASHGEPDLLLVDEVLAVGDLRFAMKCHRRMSEFRKNGGSTVMVTHSNQAIRNMCKEAIWLDRGILRASGTANEVCNEYELETSRNLTEPVVIPDTLIRYDQTAYISSVELYNPTISDSEQMAEGERIFEAGEPLKVRMYYVASRLIHKPIFVVNIQNMESVTIISNYSHFDGHNQDVLSGKGYVDFIIEKLNLKTGKYQMSVSISEGEVSNTLDWHENKYTFFIKSEKVSYGLINPYPKWIFRQTEALK